MSGGILFCFRLNDHFLRDFRPRSGPRLQKQGIFGHFWLGFGQFLDPRLSSKPAISLAVGRVRTSGKGENVPPDILEFR